MPSQRKTKKIVKKSGKLDLEKIFFSNFIVNEAIASYVNEFKKKQIPFAYIKFFFISLSQSKKLDDLPIIRRFFENTSDVDMYCYIYYLTFNNVVKSVNELSDNSSYFVLYKTKAPSTLTIYNQEKPNIGFSLQQIKEEIYVFSNQAPHYVRNAYALFISGDKEYIEHALDYEYLKDFKEGKKNNTKKIDSKLIISKSFKDDILISEPAPVFERTQKVYQLHIPKLSLPTKYPSRKSRIHSAYYVSQILGIPETIDLINNLKITNVLYTQSFLDLRENAEKEAITSNSDFFKNIF